jgi:hypothetical protein
LTTYSSQYVNNIKIFGEPITTLTIDAYSITNDLDISTCPMLTTINFPNLTYIGGSLNISNNMPLVTTINFPNLVNVGEVINITSNTLTALNLTSLKNTGYLRIISSSITNLTLPSLTTCGACIISAFSADTISFPSLIKIGPISGNVVNIFNDINSTAYSTSSTSNGTLNITVTNNITTFNFPLLRSVANSMSISAANTTYFRKFTFSTIFPLLKYIGNITLGAFSVGNIFVINSETLDLSSIVYSGSISLIGFWAKTVNLSNLVYGNVSGLNTSTTNINLSSLVVGGVQISGTNITTLDLPNLTTLTGTLSLNSAIAYFNVPNLTRTLPGSILTAGGTSSAMLTNLSFPSLASCDGQMSFSGGYITSIDFPVLTKFSGPSQILFQTLTSLRTLSFPSLITIQCESFRFVTLSLRSVSFPVLTKSSALSFETGLLLKVISLPEVTVFNGTFNVTGCAQLRTISCPNLVTCYESLTLSSAASSTFTTLNFPNLIRIFSNFTLTYSSNPMSTIDFPNLTNVNGSFDLTGTSSSVTTCSFANLLTIGSNLTITQPGNFTSLSLPSLTYIGGNASITSSVINSLSLPNLATVLGTFTLNTTSSTAISLSLPSLTTLYGLSITSSLLASISLSSSLTTIYNGGISISSLNASSTISSINFSNITNNHGFITLALPTSVTSIVFTNLVTLGTLINSGNSLTISTAPNVTSVNFTNLETISGNASFTSFPLLTSFSLPALKYVNGNLTLSGFSVCTSLSLPLLETMMGTLTIGTGFGNSASFINALSLPSLILTWGLIVQGITLSSFSATSLTTINGVLTFGALNTTGNSITTLSLPALTTVTSSLTISVPSTITSISFPNLRNIAIWSTSSGAITVTAPGATTFSLGSLLEIGGTGTIIFTAPFDQTTTSALLINIAALDGTNGTTTFSSRTITIATSGAFQSLTTDGTTARTTLIARGCTVNVS